MATNRLEERYRNEVVPALMEEFKFSTPMRVPRITKIVLNIGVGEALDNPKALDARGRRHAQHHRPAAGDHQGTAQHRQRSNCAKAAPSA